MTTHVPDTVRRYIVENLLCGDDRGFTDETDLQRTGVLDSFSTLGLLSFLEESFDIRLQAAQINAEAFRSVDAISRLVETALSRRAGRREAR